MATTLVLIAVPGGDDPRLISVVVLPRLSGATPLSAFPDMLRWTQRVVDAQPTVDLDLDGQPWSAAIDVAALRPDLWEALFTAGLPVDDFLLEDHRDATVRSAPTGALVDLVEDIYGELGLRSPGRPPTARDLDEFLHIGRDATAEAGVAAFAVERRLWSPSRPGALDREVVEQRLHERLATTPPTRTEALDRFLAQRRAGRAERSDEPWPGRPDPADARRRLDVHGVLGSLAHHPALLRALGLVFELRLDDEAPKLAPALPGGAFPTIGVRGWSLPAADGEQLALPRTATDPGSFLPAPSTFTTTAPRGGVARGAIELDPALWSLVQLDVEGAVTKLLNLSERDPVGGRADPEVAIGLPTLRSDGLGISSLLQAPDALLAFGRAARVDAAIRGGPGEILTAAHLTHGYRADVWREVNGTWSSLHRRLLAYDIGGIAWMAEDEGFATAALAAPPATPDTLDAAEVVVRWTGWSLSTPRPYKPIGREVAVDDPGTEPEGGAPETSPLSMVARPAPRSLPALRFGDRYRMRLRAVDIGGGGLGPEVAGELPALPIEPVGRRYLRYEPVAAPIVVTVDGQGAASGEHRRPELVIGSRNLTPEGDALATPNTASAQLLAPKATVDLVERHGCLDDANGRLRSAAEVHALLAERDVMIDRADNAGEAAVAHLCDPLARGVALRGLPGVPDGWLGSVGPDGTLHFAETAPLKLEGAEAGVVVLRYAGSWPDLVPLNVRLVEGTGLPTWEASTRTLVVALAKGRRTSARASSLLHPDDLALLGVWEWFARRLAADLGDAASLLGDWAGAGGSLTERVSQLAAITRLALEGGHWALTPGTTLRLEHRVVQPVGVPRLTRFADRFARASPDPGVAALDVTREAQSTSASLSGGLVVDLPSTAAVVMRASWSDPFDDVAQAAPGRVARDDVVGRIEIPDRVATGDVLATPGSASAVVLSEGALGWAGKDVVAGVELTSPVRLEHAIGDTRHHVVAYRAEAVSRDAAQETAGTVTSRYSEPVALHVPASASPDAPIVSEVVPAFRWLREHATDVSTSVREARTVRVYLERPWFSSGDGELLGVACLPGAEILGDPLCAYRDAVSLWGLDPLHAGGDLFPDAPNTSSFPEALATGRGLAVPGLQRTVDVAGHAVTFDALTGQWFADIVLDATSSYTPFVRLVLVRYQPHALSGREISAPVAVDHLQLSPDRGVTVATLPDDPRRRRVVVTGVAPMSPGPGLPFTAPSHRNVIEVSVERAVPERGPELGWELAPVEVATVSGALAQGVRQAILWRGEVVLDDPSGSGLRLLVVERERYRSDPRTLAEMPGLVPTLATATRIVFAETIALGPPVAAPEVPDIPGGALEFTAPLFAGDAFLTACLNGASTLGDRPGDAAPADSVRRYQSALVLLGLDPGPVDGVWGPAVYAASLQFKTALDLRTQGGVTDGYGGARTMAAMERIFGYGRFDEAAAAGIDLAARTGEQTNLGDGVVTVAFEGGVVAGLDWLTTRAIPAPLAEAWLADGGPAGVAGRPAGDPFVLLDAVNAQRFERAALVQTAGGDVAIVPLEALDALETGVAGVPLAAAAPLVGGAGVSGLAGSLGAVLFAPGTPVVALPQAVFQRWIADTAGGDSPGLPLAAGFAAPAGGRAFEFTGGTLVLAPDGSVGRLAGAVSGLDRYRLPRDPDRHLGPAIDGSDVRLLVGSDAFFASIAADLTRVAAGGFVYLASWNCQVDLKCFPGESTLRAELTRVAGRGAEVRMQLWAADPASTAAGPLMLLPGIAAAILLIEKAKLKPNVANRLAIAAVNALPTGFAFVDSNHATFGSHHQKIVLVHTGTELVAYVGGFEFTDDRVLPVSKGAPLFDVSVRIAGPGAAPVLTTFAERWAAHPAGAARPLERVGLAVPAASTGPVRVQVGQTYSAGFPFPRAIRTAGELAAKAIESSRSYFFVEDQYFVGDPRLGAAIRSALARGSMGIVVIAAEDSVEDLPDVPFRRRAFIDPIAAAFPGRFLVFEAVGDDATSTGPHAYVHAKLVLADDEILVIGSMNSSRRSWTHDSEVMAALVDQNGPAGAGPGAPGFAKAARMDLWSRHLKPTVIAALPVPIEPLPAALLAWTAAAAGVPGLSIRPYPPPSPAPPRPAATLPPTFRDRLLDTYWDTLADPA